MIHLPRITRACLLGLLLTCGGIVQSQPATELTNQPAAQPTAEHRELVVDGVTRGFELFVPQNAGADLPLLVVLHGRGGNGAGMARVGGFSELAEAVVAYPDGLEAQWNYLTGVGNNPGVDDVSFMHQVVEEISTEHPIDSSRIFAVGYSNGGFMVQRLACEADSPFNAFASVAGAGFGGMPEVCDQPRPLSMMLVHGTADQVVPWPGHAAMLGGREMLLSASVPQTFAFWVAFANCGGRSESTSVPLPGPRPESVEVIRVTDCPRGQQVALYALVGGDHSWPRIPAPGGGVAFDASREILEFFGLAGE